MTDDNTNLTAAAGASQDPDCGCANLSTERPHHFIQQAIEDDLKPGHRAYGQTIHTRFPPEPNGYLHIGHAKAICINFTMAQINHGLCNLRMDDTNPAKEDTEYVDAIKEDIHWLGFDWADRFYYASDYFPVMYECAEDLIRQGLAYVCDLSAEEIRQTRGTLTQPGVPSPYRDRSPEENLDLFHRMREGAFADGSHTLRARIDMASGNINLRDPVLYRISHLPHHRTGTTWCIYPMYDFAHPIEDAIEGITHSLCSIEFEDHRPLYDWVVEHCPLPSKPRQIEFARLGMNYTMMSKRKLRALVEQGIVSGWDDPRMPTLRGLRRRGYTPLAVRNFCARIGVSKVPNVVDYAFLEHCLREDLNQSARRVMAVLDPVRLTLTNYPEEAHETFSVENNPERPEDGRRTVTFSKQLWIERTDFMEEPFRKYFRLYPGNEVRLKEAYIIKCTGCRKDENGNVTEVLATYDPASRGGNAADGHRVKGTIHWVDQANCLQAEVRLYDKLFLSEDPDADGRPYEAIINPDSLKVCREAKLEAGLAQAQIGEAYQFMRNGYFTLDNRDSRPDHLIFNRSVSLKDSFKLPGAN
ncbi:MAG: glutamine--tRNA ligase/YqeY domain fusion protein [Oscillospiraceae bacterium]|nr:glutamine--tRNA ligase/YqeY domain fusion protein [Oscillospiraceae bacterium]